MLYRVSKKVAGTELFEFTARNEAEAEAIVRKLNNCTLDINDEKFELLDQNLADWVEGDVFEFLGEA